MQIPRELWFPPCSLYSITLQRCSDGRGMPPQGSQPRHQKRKVPNSSLFYRTSTEFTLPSALFVSVTSQTQQSWRYRSASRCHRVLSCDDLGRLIKTLGQEEGTSVTNCQHTPSTTQPLPFLSLRGAFNTAVSSFPLVIFCTSVRP